MCYSRLANPYTRNLFLLSQPETEPSSPVCFLEISWADISYICGRVRVAGCFRVLLLLRTFELLPELLFEPLSRSLGAQAIARHGRQRYIDK